MIVQLYSLTHEDDVRALVDLGVDHFGFAVGEQAVPAQIPVDRARTLFELVPDDRVIVALSVHETVEEVLAFARQVDPDILHICSSMDTFDVTDHRDIRAGLPTGMSLMKAIEVAGPEAIAPATTFAAESDFIILDTATESVPGIGASGQTHDWEVSRAIVDAVDVPVILAGGLGPENVAEAVRTVRPAGVDSYSKTSRTTTRKDHDRVRAFVDAARAAAG